MKKRMEIYTTSFWRKTSKYYELFDYMIERLIPDIGESDTIHGEFLRAVARINYDICNNGFCNAEQMQSLCAFVISYFNDMNCHFNTNEKDIESFKKLLNFNEEKDSIPYHDKQIMDALDRTIEKVIFWCEYEEMKKSFNGDIEETPLSLMEGY